MRRKFDTKRLYLFAIAMSLVLYIAGVLSGLYATRLIKSQTETDIDGIRDSISGFRSSLENIQIQQSFFNLLSKNEDCTFSKLSMDYMVKELNYFWRKLPYRIEEYEKGQNIDPEFPAIKKDYIFLALKAWVIATQNFNKCDKATIPILYFYSQDCESCTRQGEHLDKLKQDMQLQNKEVIAFAIDLGSNESSIDLIRDYYNITKAPAVIISNKVLYGRVYDEKEIREEISRN